MHPQLKQVRRLFLMCKYCTSRSFWYFVFWLPSGAALAVFEYISLVTLICCMCYECITSTVLLVLQNEVSGVCRCIFCQNRCRVTKKTHVTTVTLNRASVRFSNIRQRLVSLLLSSVRQILARKVQELVQEVVSLQ